MRAKKRFGQNFLKDTFYLEQIIQSIPKWALNYKIIEIGAGLGDLTQRLLGLGNITSYEIDKDLVEILEQKYEAFLQTKQWQLISRDVLELWRDGSSLQEEPFVIVANLPYNVATKIILKAFRDILCRGFVVMVQQEVAEKFCSKSGESNFGALSVLAQSVGRVEFLFSVPPSAFTPPPKVNSAVFKLEKFASPFESKVVFEQLENLLQVSFTSPRKMLFKNLRHSFSEEKIEKAFKRLDISKTVRPHELEIATYHRLLEFL